MCSVASSRNGHLMTCSSKIKFKVASCGVLVLHILIPFALCHDKQTLGPTKITEDFFINCINWVIQNPPEDSHEGEASDSSDASPVARPFYVADACTPVRSVRDMLTIPRPLHIELPEQPWSCREPWPGNSQVKCPVSFTAPSEVDGLRNKMIQDELDLKATQSFVQCLRNCRCLSWYDIQLSKRGPKTVCHLLLPHRWCFRMNPCI